MLVYTPAFDIYYCIFRLLSLLQTLPLKEYEVDKLKILDYYFLFPSTLASFKFPRRMISFKGHIKTFNNKYENIENPTRIFYKLAPYQFESMKSLASYKLIDTELFSQRYVKKTDLLLPKELSIAIKHSLNKNERLFNFIVNDLASIELDGRGGLKERSGLLEYRYDKKS